MLMPYNDCVHTITADNGRGEFTGHQHIAEALGAVVYFAHPYSSWERGANENANGLLRQYVKKGTGLRTVTDDDIAFAQSRINNRPRKCLGFKQPLFSKEWQWPLGIRECRTLELNSGNGIRSSQMKLKKTLDLDWIRLYHLEHTVTNLEAS